MLVGNDFSVRDQVWHNDGSGGFAPIDPFARSAAHPMSFDTGDVDGDGVEEMFLTDMRPATTDTARLAEWIPLMSTMNKLDNPTSHQKVRNVLQVPQADGTFRDDAERAGIDAAGWAWSARFGDLDNDGDVDLHVTNGMIAAETFHYLANAEIVEPNIAFTNRGDGSFGIADWGLGSTASGRGSVLVDLDLDGRLDVVVNNLDSPAVAFENRLCDGGGDHRVVAAARHRQHPRDRRHRHAGRRRPACGADAAIGRRLPVGQPHHAPHRRPCRRHPRSDRDPMARRRRLGRRASPSPGLHYEVTRA